MRQLRSTVIATLATVLLAGVLVPAANAAPTTTLYAYAAGTGNPAGCPADSTGKPASECSLGQAITAAPSGATIDLATPGASGHYIGNWLIESSVTITALSGLTSPPVLDGNKGSATGCPTSYCDGPILWDDVKSVNLTVTGVDFENGNDQGHAAVGGYGDGNGGAIRFGVGPGTYGGLLTLSNDQFLDNNTEDQGGAVDVGDSANGYTPASITDVSFLGNTASNGGALAVGNTSGQATVTVADSTFSGNVATGIGGAIDNGEDGPDADSLWLLDSTFTGDRSSTGSDEVDSGVLSAQAPQNVNLGFAGDFFDGPCNLAYGVDTDDGYNVGDPKCLAATPTATDRVLGGLPIGVTTYNSGSDLATAAVLDVGPAVNAIASGATAPHAPTASQQLCPRTDEVGEASATGAPCDAGAVDLLAPFEKVAGADGSLTVSWSAPTGASSYSVYEAATAGQENLAGTAVCTGTATSCTIPSLVDGTSYYFVVVATFSGGQTAASQEVAGIPSKLPAAPTNVAAKPGDGEVTVSWTPTPNASDGGAPVTAYTVFVATSSGGENAAGTASCTTSGASCAVTTTSTGASLTDGTTYYFKVAANNDAGASALSSETSATPEPIPGPPTAVMTTVGDGKVALNWTAPASGVTPTNYSVFDSITPGGEDLSGPPECVAATAAGCTVTELTDGTAYYFDVVSNNSTGSSTSSVEVTATPSKKALPPTAVTTKPGDKQVTVSWTPASQPAGTSAVTKYDVFAAVSSGGEASDVNDSCESTGTSCVVTLDENKSALVDGTTYFFKVEAVNSAGQGALSTAEASATPEPLPGTPGNVTAIPGDGAVTVGWSAATTGGPVTSYSVYDSTKAGGENTSGTPVVCSSSTTTSCVVSGLTDGTEYWFKVVANNGTGSGTASSEVTTTPSTKPLPPTAVTATPADGQVTVSWTPATQPSTVSPVTGYAVFVATTSGQEIEDSHASCQSTSTSCVVTTDTDGNPLVNGTTYYFEVEAVNGVGQGSPSTAEASATPEPVPGPPTGLTASSNSGSVTLSWTPAKTGGPATGYSVYDATSSGGENASGSAVCTVTATTCTVTGLTNGTIYYFEVVAENAVGPAAPSAEVAARPAPTPTLVILGSHITVAKGASHTLAGYGVVGATVVLKVGSTTLATTTVGSKGTFEFVRKVTQTGSYTVTSDGKTSKALQLKVVALTIKLSGSKKIVSGKKRTLTGAAPMGLTVTLLRDGKKVATMTAGKKNTFSFKEKLTGSHKYSIRSDGVTSKSIKLVAKTD